MKWCCVKIADEMRLIWKKNDSQFDPILALVGLGFLGGSAYGIALIGHALRPGIVLLLAAVPLAMGAAGFVILVREYQLWKIRSSRGNDQ